MPMKFALFRLWIKNLCFSFFRFGSFYFESFCKRWKVWIWYCFRSSIQVPSSKIHRRRLNFSWRKVKAFLQTTKFIIFMKERKKREFFFWLLKFTLKTLTLMQKTAINMRWKNIILKMLKLFLSSCSGAHLEKHFHLAFSCQVQWNPN